MAMGRSRSALPDLNESIKLNPRFAQVFYNLLSHNTELKFDEGRGMMMGCWTTFLQVSRQHGPLTISPITNPVH